MKFFACLVFAVVFAVAYAAPAPEEYSPEKRSLKPGPPAPPCQKAVLVSCAPLVQKVPCKGSPAPLKGAYSEYVPQYLPYSAYYDHSDDYEY